MIQGSIHQTSELAKILDNWETKAVRMQETIIQTFLVSYFLRS
jgi:hypothetical protein